MIVWVASFPRSGNTFLRILLNRIYGIETSTIYDVDGVADRVGAELVGAIDRPSDLATLRAGDEVHFIKTHRSRDPDVADVDRAICLVRDGRDAVVSWARLNSTPATYESELKAKILNRTGTSTWGANVLSWLSFPGRELLRYEDLIAAPVPAVTSMMANLVPTLVPTSNPDIPSMATLHEADAGFFRRGRAGSHRDELPPTLRTLFHADPDNRAAMELLGYE
jgi:hypothetical protein